MATSAKTPNNDFALWEQRISGAADGSYPGVVFTADETEAINKLKALRAKRNDPKSGATPKEWEEFDRFMKEVWGRKSKTAGRRRKTRKHTRRSRKTRRSV
jgi:hypothetical protein